MVLLYIVLSFAFLISAVACFWKLAARLLRLALLIGPAITIAIGAWCVHQRATQPTGESLDWPGALRLSGLAMVLYLVPVAVLLGAAALMSD
jgi:hypothetical protein